MLDDQGTTVLLLNHVDDLTASVLQPADDRAGRGEVEHQVENAEADVYARAHDLESALAAEADASRRVAALTSVAVAVSSAQTVEEITDLMIERGLAALGADGGAVGVLGTEGVLHLTITESLGAQAITSYAQLPLSGSLPACVAAASEERVLLPDRAASLAFSPDMAQVLADTGCQAWASVPLRGSRGILGSLTVGWAGGHPFPPREVEILDAFAAHCAHSIERIAAHQVERAAAAATTRMAETLQMSLLTEPVQPDHLQIAVRYRPAAHDAKVGGDWYDAFLTSGDELSLVIGDVAGHDRAAAATMGQLRNLLRGISYTLNKPPAAILTALEEAMEHFAVGSFASAIIAQVEQTVLDKVLKRRRLRWSNAGHPPPLLLHPDGTAQLLHTTPERLPVPELSVFDAQLKPTGERTISTTMAFVRILTTLLQDKQIGKRVVPIVPDESRTFGMEGLFRQFGIWSQVGQLYRPEDANQLMYYKEDKSGQMLQEGINEAGAMSS